MDTEGGDMQRHWLSFKKDEIMYTDGLETEYFLCGGTAQFPLFHTMIVLTRLFVFSQSFVPDIMP